MTVVFMLAAWLAAGVFIPLVIEGYSLGLLISAQALIGGVDLAVLDPGQDTVVYYDVTRWGTVRAVAGLATISGMSVQAAGIVLKIACFALLAWASCMVTRRLFALSVAETIGGTVLFPTIYFAFYYFSDTLPASALFMAGLAGTLSRTLAGPALGGVLFATAAVCRPDIAVLAPVIPLALYKLRADVRQALVRSAIVGFAAIGTLLLWMALGYDPLEAFERLAAYKLQYDGLAKFDRVAGALVRAFLPGSAVLLLVGVWSLARSRQWLVVALGCVPLALLIVSYGLTLWQTRYLLIGLIFAIPVALAGVAAIAGDDLGKWSKPARLVVAAGLAWALFPPLAVNTSEGTQPLVGQWWTPALAWHDWRLVEERRPQVDRAIANLGAVRADAQVSSNGPVLSLLQHGWVPARGSYVCGYQLVEFINPERTGDVAVRLNVDGFKGCRTPRRLELYFCSSLYRPRRVDFAWRHARASWPCSAAEFASFERGR